jgi:type III restriction enzyme
MSNPFFDHPILNSPYEIPRRHWELDETGQPSQQVLDTRRRADFITPIPKPKKRWKGTQPQAMTECRSGLGAATPCGMPTTRWRNL